MLAAQGRDISLSEERIEGVRNFANKVWNASRLALTFLEDMPSAYEKPGVSPLFLPDKWIRSRAQKVICEVTESLDAYKFNEAANTLYNFIWHEFCDWYLELIKPNLYGKVTMYDNNTTKETLNNTLTDILKLLHPIMPFITEEIYQKLPHRPPADSSSTTDKGELHESIMVSTFPVYNEAQTDEKSEAGMDMIMGIIDVIRNIRGETGIAPNVKVEAIIRANGNRGLLEEYGYYIKELAKVGELVFITGEEAPDKSAVGIYKGVEIFVLIKDLIDAPKELARIDKELAKIEEEMGRVFNKLNNTSFREKAPPDVIKKNELNYNVLLEKKDKLTESRKVLEGIAGK